MNERLTATCSIIAQIKLNDAKATIIINLCPSLSLRESRMTKTTIDIQAFINEHPFTRYQWMILALCFITVAMDGFDTAIIGFIASDLVQEWGVEKSALGPVMKRRAGGPGGRRLNRRAAG